MKSSFHLEKFISPLFTINRNSTSPCSTPAEWRSLRCATFSSFLLVSSISETSWFASFHVFSESAEKEKKDCCAKLYEKENHPINMQINFVKFSFQTFFWHLEQTSDERKEWNIDKAFLVFGMRGGPGWIIWKWWQEIWSEDLQRPTPLYPRTHPMRRFFTPRGCKKRRKVFFFWW